MKKTLLFTTFFVAAFSLLGSGGINATCLEGTVGNGDGNNSNCAAGRVSFSGTGYPTSVHITVTRGSTGEVIDDYDYESSVGTIEFTETLVPADTYSVRLTASNGMLVTKDVTTGGGN
jgi:hypothetical protein